jgi:hypothetical protein
MPYSQPLFHQDGINLMFLQEKKINWTDCIAEKSLFCILNFVLFFTAAPTPPSSHLCYLAGEDKSTKNVPSTAEFIIQLALMLTLSIPMMAIFPLLENSLSLPS